MLASKDNMRSCEIKKIKVQQTADKRYNEQA